MSRRGPRVVAELGRPETPDETARRKAEFSAAYRASQNTRNLIAALLATLAVVAVIFFAVPRGTPPAQPRIDVAAVAQQLADAEGRAVLAPVVPESWLVNAASVTGDDLAAWTVVYVPAEESGYLRFAQGFDADAAWPTRVLQGAAPGVTQTVDGVVWQTYDIPDPSRAGNVSIAWSTTAGPDTVMIYGTSGEDAVRTVAAGIAARLTALAEGDAR